MAQTHTYKHTYIPVLNGYFGLLLAVGPWSSSGYAIRQEHKNEHTVAAMYNNVSTNYMRTVHPIVPINGVNVH